VVIPELFRRPSLLEVFKHPRALLLKLRLLAEPGVVVADVPALAGADEAPPERAVVRVLVSGVNASSMRAVNYARTLGIQDTRAVNFAFSAEEAEVMRREWAAHGPRIPLELDDAARVAAIWGSTRERYGSSGRFLFGAFTIADAMFAPVVSRFRTYGLPLTGPAAAYAEAVWNDPDFQMWYEAARSETLRVPKYEDQKAT